MRLRFPADNLDPSLLRAAIADGTRFVAALLGVAAVGYIGPSILPNTRLGVVILAVPGLGLCALAAYYFGRTFRHLLSSLGTPPN